MSIYPRKGDRGPLSSRKSFVSEFLNTFHAIFQLVRTYLYNLRQSPFQPRANSKVNRWKRRRGQGSKFVNCENAPENRRINEKTNRRRAKREPPKPLPPLFSLPSQTIEKPRFAKLSIGAAYVHRIFTRDDSVFFFFLIFEPIWVSTLLNLNYNGYFLTIKIFEKFIEYGELKGKVLLLKNLLKLGGMQSSLRDNYENSSENFYKYFRGILRNSNRKVRTYLGTFS